MSLERGWESKIFILIEILVFCEDDGGRRRLNQCFPRQSVLVVVVMTMAITLDD